MRFGHRRLLTALAVDALGSGLFIPFSLLFFTATTDLRLPEVGVALSIAAFVRVPATAAAGMFTDKFGARTALLGSNLFQFAGFLGYLAVESVPHLLVAAVAVQVGNSTFWVAYPALVDAVAEPGSQERWFALITALRNAGLALGALAASLAVAFAGTLGYQGIVLFNAASFLLATVLVGSWRGGRRPTSGGAAPAARPSWGPVLRDRPFLVFVALNVGFVLLSLAFIIAAPVFLVRSAGLPDWVPGVVLAGNALLAAAGATTVVARITGRRRGRVLLVSQAIMAAGFAAILATAYTPVALGLAAVAAGVLLITLTELIQGPTVAAIVNEAGTAADRGRYISIYQMTFSVVDIIAPALLTALLAQGPVAVWVPLILLALVNALVLPALSRRLPALQRPIGHVPVATG